MIHLYSIYTALSPHPFNCTHNSPHRHLTKCRSYRLENLWIQIQLSRRSPDFLCLFGKPTLLICNLSAHGQHWGLETLPPNRWQTSLFFSFISPLAEHGLKSCNQAVRYYLYMRLCKLVFWLLIVLDKLQKRSTFTFSKQISRRGKSVRHYRLYKKRRSSGKQISIIDNVKPSYSEPAPCRPHYMLSWWETNIIKLVCTSYKSR